MLASEPPSSRVLAAGITVRVNGADVVEAAPAERRSGAVSCQEKKAGPPSNWAQTTVTWRNGAQRYPEEGAGMIKQQTAASSVSLQGPASPPQLVHVIRVNPDRPAGVVQAPRPATIQIGPYKPLEYGGGQDKISVVAAAALKGEDERSSSGASSAPGSDSERSDSDREADDGTDSGFSPSRRHRARVVVLGSPGPVLRRQSSSSGELYSSGKVNLTISSYIDKEAKAAAPRPDAWDMQFHLRELDTAADAKGPDSEDVQTKIAAAHALLSGNSGGTFPLKNRVRSSIVSLLVQSAANRNYDQEEVGRIVFYTTSMGIVRTTFERCRKVRKILDTLMIKFEERDVFMNRGFQQEVRERLGLTRVIVPQVFVEGRHLGSAEIVEQLNEIGHLRELLRPYKKSSVGGVCQQCGGYRYLLCPVCGGSKKSVTHRHHFSEDLVALRCVTCDESGLIRCQLCLTGDV